MHKLIIISIAFLSVFSCATKEQRTPASLNLSSYVVVPRPELSAEEIKMYQRQCHTQMVEKLLDTTDRLRKIKDYPQKNIQVSDPINSKYLDLTAPIKMKYQYFNFTVQDQNGMKYDGYMYISHLKGKTQIRPWDDGKVFHLQCWFEDTRCDLIIRDPLYEAAVLKDSEGNKVFSDACARKMQNGKGVDERCEPL